MAASPATSPRAAQPGAPPTLLCPLYPQANAFRDVLDLSGLWDFQADPEDVGVAERWFASELPSPRQAAVPGSWGEQFPELRDYLGPAWYATHVVLPAACRAAGPGVRPPQLLLRVGSANYAAAVYVNGALVGAHEGGHLPFQVDVSDAARGAAALRVAIRVEGLLSPARVPPGAVSARPQQFPNVSYDFFPYAGLHRAVTLLCLPREGRLEDVTFVTARVAPDHSSADVRVAATAGDVWSGVGIATLRAGRAPDAPLAAATALWFDRGDAPEASMTLPFPRLWSPASPSLYRLTVTLLRDGGNGAAAAAVRYTNGDAAALAALEASAVSASGPAAAATVAASDTYALEVGVRTVVVAGDALLLNGAPLRLRGFGKHEDCPLAGRGYCAPAAVRDAAAMKWCGANSYRTAHYPHAEESLHVADRVGLAVIYETPACYLCFHDDLAAQQARLTACLRAVRELQARDKNRACVLAWSLANEPEANAHLATHGVAVPPATDESWKTRGAAFFADLFAAARLGDPQRRPLTFAAHPASDMSWVEQCDLVLTNRYNGWYDCPGEPARGAAKLGAALDREHDALRRPFVLSEFGADAIAGTHAEPAEMWSEEYQVDMIQRYLALADDTRPWLIGHHVWNLTDFKTPQAIRRPQGLNHKGVFTRDRRPKMAAHALRAAWAPAAQAEAAAARDAEAKATQQQRACCVATPPVHV